MTVRCTLTRFSDFLLEKAVSNGTAVPDASEEGFANAAAQAPQVRPLPSLVKVGWIWSCKQAPA